MTACRKGHALRLLGRLGSDIRKVWLQLGGILGQLPPRLGGTQYCCWQDPNAVASSDGRKKWPRVMKGFGQVSACAYYCSRCLVLAVDRLMWWRDASSTEYSMYELPNGDGIGKVPMMRIA